MDLALQWLSGLVISLAGIWISIWLAGRYSASAAQRRRVASRGGNVQLPVRVRGRTPTYPRYWRLGYLSSKDGIYRPRGRWGEELELAGMTVVEVHQGGPKNPGAARYGLSGSYDFLAVLECVDSHGRNVLISAYDGDVKLLTKTLEKPSRAPQPPQPMRRLRWLRNRIQFGIAAMVVVGAITGAPLTIAVATSTAVEATITRDPGGGELCFAEAQSEGHLVTDRLPCEGKLVGTRVGALALGWPLAGTVDAPKHSYEMAVFTWLPAWLGLIFLVIMRVQQRRLPRHLLGITTESTA